MTLLLMTMPFSDYPEPLGLLFTTVALRRSLIIAKKGGYPPISLPLVSLSRLFWDEY